MEPLLIFAIVASAVLPFVPCLLCLFVKICKCDKTCNRCDVLGTIYEDPLLMIRKDTCDGPKWFWVIVPMVCAILWICAMVTSFTLWPLPP